MTTKREDSPPEDEFVQLVHRGGVSIQLAVGATELLVGCDTHHEHTDQRCPRSQLEDGQDATGDGAEHQQRASDASPQRVVGDLLLVVVQHGDDTKTNVVVGLHGLVVRVLGVDHIAALVW